MTFNCLYYIKFADYLTLLAFSVTGLQTQLNALSGAAKTLGLVVDLDKTKAIVFRKRSFLVPEKDTGMTKS